MNTGWICPKCNAVMAPFYPNCFFCKPNIKDLWISVKDYLPDIDKETIEVLVVEYNDEDKYHDAFYQIHVAVYNIDKTFSDIYGEKLINPTHWMKLPDLPKIIKKDK